MSAAFPQGRTEHCVETGRRLVSKQPAVTLQAEVCVGQLVLEAPLPSPAAPERRPEAKQALTRLRVEILAELGRVPVRLSGLAQLKAPPLPTPNWRNTVSRPR